MAATKTITSSQDEISIFHLVPNIDIDSKKRTLKILNSNAISSLGFLDSQDKEFMGFGLNKIVANGSFISKHFNHKALADYTFSGGSNKITRTTGSFLSDGVSEGNLAFIESDGSTDDNGCYLITDVSDLYIELDHTFLNSKPNNANVIILKNTSSIKDFTFSELSIPTLLNTSGSMYFDVYYNEKSLSLFLNKKMEISGLTNSSALSIGISKVSNNFIKNGREITISIASDGVVTFLDEDSSSSSEVRLISTGRYTVYNKSKTKFIELDISMSGASFSPKTLVFYGTDNHNYKNLKVGSFLFSNSLGRVFGSAGASSGIPSFSNEAKSGPIDEAKISDSFVESKIGIPLFESIGNYVAFGLNLSAQTGTSTSLEISLSGGIAYIKGRRISFSNKENLTFSNLDPSKNYYVILNDKGSIEVREEISSSDYLGYSSSFDKEQISIGYYNTASQEYTELIIPLDSISDKNDKIIYVNPSYVDGNTARKPNIKSAHFSNIYDAIEYLRKHKKITGSPHTPRLCLLDGTHIVSKTIVVDFSLNIFGLSELCVIEPEFGSGISLLNEDLSGTSTIVSDQNSIFKIEKNSDNLNIFSMKNIRFNYSASSNGMICGILIENDNSLTPKNNIRLENILFEGISNTYSNSTIYKFLLPIVWQNLSSGSVSLAQNFNHLYMENVKFSGIKTNGFGVLLHISGSGNNIYRLSAKDCGFYSCRQFSSSNQVFCASELIEPTLLFSSSDFTNIEMMVEENTIVT